MRVCVGSNGVCAGYETHGFVCVLTGALTNKTRKKKNSRIHILLNKDVARLQEYASVLMEYAQVMKLTDSCVF